MTETEKNLLKGFITIWMKSHPDEISHLVYNRKILVAQQKNKFAASKEMSIRHALELPVDLARKITNNFPSVFKDKKVLHWFMKEFPIFAIPEKV